jgi:hypothetical protein
MKLNEDETFEILKKPNQNQEQTIHRTLPVHQIIRTTRESQPKDLETFKEEIKRKLNEIK